MIHSEVQKRLQDLIITLEQGCQIYDTSKGNYFHFVKFKNEKLYFDIPNHKKPEQPTLKSIRLSYVLDVLNVLEEKRVFERRESEYKDCRFTAIFAFLKLVLKEKVTKKRGKMVLV